MIMIFDDNENSQVLTLQTFSVQNRRRKGLFVILNPYLKSSHFTVRKGCFRAQIGAGVLYLFSGGVL